MSDYSYRSDWHQERRQRRFLLVSLAFAISFAFHIFMMLTVSEWHLERVQVSTEALSEIRPPLQVERLELDPIRALANPATGHPEDGAGLGVPREELRELARLPDPALVTPPPHPADSLAGTLVHPQAPPRQPTAIGWQPRQQIVAIVDQVVKDDLATLPRREIAAIERVARAPDYVPDRKSVV